AYLPRPLTTRGHRLVYSNAIGALTVISIVLLVATRARVADLIPLYACTVFTGFTMAGAGMTKYHLGHPGPKRARNLAVALTTFVASALVTLIFVVTEFTRGAWLIVVMIPLLVLMLTRTHRRYEDEKHVLAEDAAAPSADEAHILRNHVVLVLVDTLDLATARAIQLARSLAISAEVRAVHFVIDAAHAEQVASHWGQLGHQQLALELVECPDRRLARAATELAADLAADGQTEVTLVLPRRIYRGFANRLLHGNTADRIVAAVSTLPHVSATIAPFDVGGLLARRKRSAAVAADGAEEEVRPRRAPDAHRAPPRPRHRARHPACGGGYGRPPQRAVGHHQPRLRAAVCVCPGAACRLLTGASAHDAQAGRWRLAGIGRQRRGCLGHERGSSLVGQGHRDEQSIPLGRRARSELQHVGAEPLALTPHRELGRADGHDRAWQPGPDQRAVAA